MKVQNFKIKVLIVGLIIGFLLISTTNTLADWLKTENSSSGTGGGTPNPTTEYNEHSNNHYAQAYLDYLMLYVQCNNSADNDPNNDTLTATSAASNCWLYDGYSKDGEAEPHSFWCNWIESFDWRIYGDADNSRSGSGTANTEINIYIDYDSSPGTSIGNCNGVNFTTSSKKVESSSWLPKILKYNWKLPSPWPELTWDDSADSDSFFKDVASGSEHSEDKACSGSVYSEESDNVFAVVTVSANGKAETLNNAMSAGILGSVVIESFELIE